MSQFILIGRGGALDANRIIAIAQAKSAPVKRLIEAAEPDHVLYLTYGEPRQSVLLLDNGFLAIVSLSVDELLTKLPYTEVI